MMKFLAEATSRLSEPLPKKRFWFALIFSFYGPIMYYIPFSINMVQGILLIFMILAMFAIFPLLRKRFHFSGMLGSSWISSARPWKKRTGKVMLFFLLPIGLGMTIKVILMIAIPTLPFILKLIGHQVTTIGTQIPLSSFSADILASIFASMEEVWRWSCIVVLLILLKHLIPAERNQTKSLAIRLIVSICISSVFFGMMHIGEFSGNNLVPIWGECWLGLSLALVALFAGSIEIAMITHVMYDMITSIFMYFHPSPSWEFVLPLSTTIITALILSGLLMIHRKRSLIRKAM